MEFHLNYEWLLEDKHLLAKLVLCFKYKENGKNIVSEWS